MKVYSFTAARQNLAEVLADAQDEEVMIKRRNGETYIVRRQSAKASPLDVSGVSTRATFKDIVAAVRESRTGSR